MNARPDSFSQTDLSAHGAWATLSWKHRAAAAVMHHLVILSDKQNAVVISQQALANQIGCSKRSIIRAIAVLVEGRWIERARIGHNTGVNAYIINSRVSWKDTRARRGLACIQGTIVLDSQEQDDETLMDTRPMRQIDTQMILSVVPTVPDDPKDPDQLGLDL